MDSPPIYFVAGLPRSGSTLLMNLLGQNPAHHVTPTNGLLELLVTIRDKWQEFIEFRAQGISTVQPRIVSLMKGMIEGFYRDEFAAGKVIFDKSRGWLAYIEMMETIFDRPITVLVTVRDIRAIAASFEKLHQQNPITSARPGNYLLGQTVEGRTAMYMGEGGVIGLAVNRLRDAMLRPHNSRILMIPYNVLCREPRAILDRLHNELGLPAFTYNPEHVEQLTQEDDAVHGMSLHSVRSKVELSDETPWEGVLPDSLCAALEKEYADIQQYAMAGA